MAGSRPYRATHCRAGEGFIVWLSAPGQVVAPQGATPHQGLHAEQGQRISMTCVITWPLAWCACVSGSLWSQR
eukprot:1042978-Alexandrium_andersonii.AAC.1